MSERTTTNSIDMQLVQIPVGNYWMGKEPTDLPDDVSLHPHTGSGDYDEHPRHRVKITSPFHLGTHPVTNRQFEEYDANHRYLRGKLGFSLADDEAAVFVSWHEAKAFCAWLTDREGRSYRLPTEAEWEYACRAGTETAFSTGAHLPTAWLRNAKRSWFPDPARSSCEEIVPLRVGTHEPNPWGLHDMHGLVEEWCEDWYGPYDAEAQVNPNGAPDGLFRVTRGGSHSTEPYYLRSSNRSAALPDDCSWLIGFRVLLSSEATGAGVVGSHGASRYWRGASLAKPIVQRVERSRADLAPLLEAPIPFVRIPDGSYGPLFSKHNHEPALVVCKNGDLLALWFSTFEEAGREMTIAQSRLPMGGTEWEPASLFMDAADRNMTGLALFRDEDGRLLQFGGISAAATWGNIATYMRVSEDDGYTWSAPRIINHEHTIGHMPIDGVFRAQDGSLVIHCDAVTGGDGGTYLYLSLDGGSTWHNPGGRIAGIHAGVVQLSDGRLFAFGRGDNVDGKMPQSVSADMGRTWEISASPFEPISSGQRLVLMRLDEGPLLFASFAHDLPMVDGNGRTTKGHGLFVSVSYDEGGSWPIRKLLTMEGSERTLDGGAWTGNFAMSATSAEPKGYCTARQGDDGVIHLLSSRLHYRLNLAWIEAPKRP